MREKVFCMFSFGYLLPVCLTEGGRDPSIQYRQGGSLIIILVYIYNTPLILKGIVFSKPVASSLHIKTI